MASLSREDEEAIASAARRYYGRDPAHGWDHVLAVVNVAREIARELGADEAVVVAAAYFHDAAPRLEAGHSAHPRASAELARSELARLGWPADLVERVAETIVGASYEARLAGRGAETPEAQALSEADLLDAMGARGIARAFAFAAFYGSPEGLGILDWDPENPPRLEMNLEGPDPSAVYHFASKLLHLRERIRSETGRRLAEGRHRFMVEFLRRYADEMAGRA